MKASKKRGFTIIELVIVIAVIAILAAVLIPTFSNVIQKAKEANDTVMVKTMNTALVNDSNLNGGKKHATMSDALTAVKSAGYDVTKIRNTANNNEILWDSVSDCFVYMKSGAITYIPDSQDSAADINKTWNYFRIVDNKDAIESETTYSVYLANNNLNGDIAIKTGFDAGENVVINSLTYETTATNNVVIRTNSGKLTVNAANGHVEHYNIAESVTVTAVSESTYVEHGVVSKMEVAAGAKNVVIKSTALVVELATESDKVSLESNAYVGAVTGTKAENVSGTIGGDTIKVGTYEELQALALTSQVGISLEGKTIELTADIDMTGKIWTPFGFSTDNPFVGTIDGKGHKITGLNGEGATKCATVVNKTNGAQGYAYGLICIAGDGVVVKNINFVDVDIDIADGLAVSAVVGDARGDIAIDNVSVAGKVSAMDKVGGMVGLFAYDVKKTGAKVGAEATITNSTVLANVFAEASNKYNRAGGFVGACGPDVSKAKLTIKNCVSKGNVSVKGSSEGICTGTESPCKKTGGGLHHTYYYKNAQDVASIENGAVVRVGHFVGHLNATTFVSEGNTFSGTITATNTKGTGGAFAIVNKYGENAGTIVYNDKLTPGSNDWAKYIYDPDNK